MEMPGTEPGAPLDTATAGHEPAVEARSLAYLYAAGAGLAALTLALPHTARQDDLGVTLVIAAACVGALVLLLGARRIPGWACQVFLALGTLLISAVIYFADAGDSAYASYYIWVGVYAFYFLPRTWAVAQSAFVAAVYGALFAFADLPTEAPPPAGSSPWGRSWWPAR